MKVLTVLGARPQFIKASVVSAAMVKHDGMDEIVVHTGQHFDADMSEVFFIELGMCDPKYHLGINGGSHGEMTGRMLVEVEKVMLSERPDVVLVYGDTNSTLVGALGAAKLHIPVAHVEAGLRSFNMRMPEEINRILTDHVSSWLFVPTEGAAANLSNEGIPPQRVRLVGDVMYDVALFYAAKARVASRILNQLDLQKSEYVLATVHRAENTDSPDRLNAILEGLSRVSTKIPVVLPLHPRTKKLLCRNAVAKLAKCRVMLIDPVGYLDMVTLEMNARVIATDSGGVQKEAFFHRVPCVTLRDETEWVELVQMGWNRVVPPTDAARISKAILAVSAGEEPLQTPYGDGHSADVIVTALLA